MSDESEERAEVENGIVLMERLGEVLVGALDMHRQQLQNELRRDDDALGWAIRDLTKTLTTQRSPLGDAERGEVIAYESLKLTLAGPSAGLAARAEGQIVGFSPPGTKAGNELVIYVRGAGQATDVMFKAKDDFVQAGINREEKVEGKQGGLRSITVTVPQGAVTGTIRVIFANSAPLESSTRLRIGAGPRLLGM
jgi:hypothetical protein